MQTNEYVLCFVSLLRVLQFIIHLTNLNLQRFILIFNCLTLYRYILTDNQSKTQKNIQSTATNLHNWRSSKQRLSDILIEKWLKLYIFSWSTNEGVLENSTVYVCLCVW